MARSDFKLQHRLRVRWNELDAQGIAHNAVYVVWFGIALGEYFRELPFDRFAVESRDKTQLNVVRTLVEYKSPAGMDQEILTCARIAKIGRTSMTFLFEIYDAADDRLICTGDQVWVNVGISDMRPTPWPADVLAALYAREPHLGGET